MTDSPTLKDQAAHDAAAKVADYEHGWSADIETDFAPKGLNEDTVRFISAKKNEPEWMLDWRLKAFRHWQTMPMPDWAKLNIPPIDYQDAYYYAAPRAKPKLASLDEVDPEILRVYEKLGISLEEQKVLAGVEGARKVAVDAVFDSVSVATTFRAELEKAGVIFRSISEAIREYPDLVKKWLGKVVPMNDNFFSALNCAVFSDGTFVYIPEGVRCPMELSTYFRINAENTGQFERTLIIADKGSHVSYLEGCTAPMRDENQLHARWSNWSRSTMPRSSIRPCRTGTPATPKGWAGSTTSSPSARCARASAARSAGPRLRRGQPLPGSTRAAFERRRQRWRVLLGRGHQQLPAGRYRHQDDPQRQGHPLDDHFEGHLGREKPEHLSRAGPRCAGRRGRAQFHPVRFAAARQGMRRAYRALYRGAQSERADRA
jgi:hypothetical protein